MTLALVASYYAAGADPAQWQRNVLFGQVFAGPVWVFSLYHIGKRNFYEDA